MKKFGKRRMVLRGAALAVAGCVALGGRSASGTARMAAHPAGGGSKAHSSAYPAGTVMRLHQRTVKVTISNFAFQPARLVVSPGTKVIWTNKDSDPHTVDSTKNAWTSEALDTDGQFARTFAKTGTFNYYCSIHPFMHGTLYVKK